MHRSKVSQIEANNFLDLLDESVVTIGLDKRVRYINRAAEKLLGYSLEEARSQPCSTIIRCVECDTDCHLDNAFRTGEPVNRYKTSLQNRFGNTIKVRLSSTIMEDEQGHIIGGVEVIQRGLTPGDRSPSAKGPEGGVLGQGARMLEVDSIIRAAVKNDDPVLILGEAGTGKETVARAIHEGSLRRSEKFLKLNCSVLPPEVIAGELFGTKANAYPGAFLDKEGLFEAASGGTLFLEGVESLDLELQELLLGVLRSGKITRPGVRGQESIEHLTNVRVMASSDAGLSALCGEGRFLSELLGRLSGFRIVLPPLRERREDIPHLANRFIEAKNMQLGKKVRAVSSKAMDVLMNYDYPGNISDLEKVVGHAMVLCGGRTLQPDHLPKNLFQVKPEVMDTLLRGSDPLGALERRFFLKVLSECRWNQKVAAKRLKISRTTLWRRLRELGIDPSVEQGKKSLSIFHA